MLLMKMQKRQQSIMGTARMDTWNSISTYEYFVDQKLK